MKRRQAAHPRRSARYWEYRYNDSGDRRRSPFLLKGTFGVRRDRTADAAGIGKRGSASSLHVRDPPYPRRVNWAQVRAVPCKSSRKRSTCLPGARICSICSKGPPGCPQWLSRCAEGQGVSHRPRHPRNRGSSGALFRWRKEAERAGLPLRAPQNRS